jgi:polar amino acid transport system substrate-binding protein
MQQLAIYKKVRYLALLVNKPHLSLLATLLIIVMVQSSEAAQETCDKLNVGGDNSWAPVAYVNRETNQPEGSGYDLVRKLGEHMDIPVSIKPNIPWARMMNMAAEGELDIIAGLVSTAARAKFLDFTKPFFRDTLYVFFHRNTNIDLNRIDDLLSYRRVEVRGHTAEEELDNLLKTATIIVNNYDQQISLVIAGRADYFIASQAEYYYYKKKYPRLKHLKKLLQPIKTMDVMLAVSKASPCTKHLEEFNRIISKYSPLD